MLGRVVADAVLPAVPNDVEPGAGQDAYGMGVVVLAGASALIHVGGPGVGVARTVGEVADGIT